MTVPHKIFLAASIEIFLWLILSGQYVSGRNGNKVSPHADINPSLLHIRFGEVRFFGQTGYLPLLSNNGCQGAISRLRKSRRFKPSSFSPADKSILRFCEADISGAISTLRRAIDRSPADAGLLTDLSAIYFVGSFRSHSFLDLLRALRAVDEALLADPSLKEAKFNRALILEKLSLQAEASAAWHSYLRQDPDSPWTAEALFHLARVWAPSDGDLWDGKYKLLEQSVLKKDWLTASMLVSDSKQAARQHVEIKLLALWGKAFREVQADAASRSLTIAGAISDVLKHNGGDSMAFEEVALIRKSMEIKNFPMLRDLALGHILLERGAELYRSDSFSEAKVAFDESSRAFRSASSPMALWADLLSAICDYYSFHYQAVFEKLSRIDEMIQGRSYLSLRGRLLWMIGLTEFARSNFRDSLGYFTEALKVYEAIDERENMAVVHFLLAQAYSYSGEEALSWQHRFSELELRKSILDKQRSINALYDDADASASAGFLECAEYFHDEQLRLAKEMGLASNVVEAYLVRSRKLSLLGDNKHAVDDLAQANAWIPGIKNEDIRYRLLADVWLAAAEVKKTTDLPGALVDLGKALEFFKTTGFSVDVSQILLARYKGYMLLGSRKDAEHNLLEAIDRVRDQLRKALRNSSTGPSSANVKGIYDAAISFEARVNARTNKAFDYTEEKRSRAMVDLEGFSAASESQGQRIRSIEASYRSIPVEQIQEALPRSTVLVEYELLDKKLVAFVVDSAKIRFYDLQLDADWLAEKVSQLRSNLLVSKSVDADRSGRLLFSVLVRPLVSQLCAGSRIVFIPDGPLQGLPFAALWDEQQAKYLVERFEIAVMPSASLYVTSLQRVAPRNPEILAIGIEKPNIRKRPWLPFLDNAQEEAREIAALYPRSLVLLGRNAGYQRIMAMIGQFSVIQFSGHAILNSEFPLESRLLFTGSDGVDEMSASELYGKDLRRVSLVVLSSCDSAGGQAQASEGLSGLSRAFIVNGVGAVLGSLWSVDDRSSVRIFKKFHVEFLKDGDAVGALARLQRFLVEHPNRELSRPKSWAGLEIIGGGDRMRG
jgi:CHAT domain-containing protein